MNLDSRIPDLLQPIIQDYVRLTEQRLNGLINASYIVGSIALGEFNEHFSDVDFISVLGPEASPTDLEGKKYSSNRIRFGRIVETARFLKFVINTCNGYFAS